MAPQQSHYGSVGCLPWHGLAAVAVLLPVALLPVTARRLKTPVIFGALLGVSCPRRFLRGCHLVRGRGMGHDDRSLEQVGLDGGRPSRRGTTRRSVLQDNRGLRGGRPGRTVEGGGARLERRDVAAARSRSGQPLQPAGRRFLPGSYALHGGRVHRHPVHPARRGRVVGRSQVAAAQDTRVMTARALTINRSHRRHVDKAAVMTLKGNCHRRCRPIAVLGDNKVGFPGSW